ncbi:MAG: pantoate--beta-alanine ligase [Saprospiraceae bacterium]|nr:pantoate--beta-alanine ligase [Saprospiraceae bacterium]
MYIFKRVSDLQNYLKQKQFEEKKIGFVPTMGALHLGHLTLLNEASLVNDIIVCSIFINPRQFEDTKDLLNYPNPIESDIEKLENLNCTVLFLPDNNEVYPCDHNMLNLDLGKLDKTMEGLHRPGHFKGVVEVVHRLLDIVNPDNLYMGQKDYQQFAIIKHMLKMIQSNVKIIRVPIVREPDGLAMSSRNIRLSIEGRKKASLISTSLLQAKEDANTLNVAAVKENAINFLNTHNIEIDYFEIVDGNTLQTIESFNQSDYVTACTTVRIDGVRLLDNIIIKEIVD